MNPSKSAGNSTQNPNVARFFDGYAHDFDAIYGNQNGWLDAAVNRLFRQSMEVRYRKTLEGAAPVAGRSVLDIGCGPGHYSVALAKSGAAEVLGVDFAEGMLKVARARAAREGCEGVCRFEQRDFFTYDFGRKFDYTILMGFMDYVSRPGEVVRKALSLTSRRAFFSFPMSGGFLAWQRKLRYKSRCDLFLYSRDEVERLFEGAGQTRLKLDPIGRDLFVTAEMD